MTECKVTKFVTDRDEYKGHCPMHSDSRHHSASQLSSISLQPLFKPAPSFIPLNVSQEASMVWTGLPPTHFRFPLEAVIICPQSNGGFFPTAEISKSGDQLSSIRHHSVTISQSNVSVKLTGLSYLPLKALWCRSMIAKNY